MDVVGGDNVVINIIVHTHHDAHDPLASRRAPRARTISITHTHTLVLHTVGGVGFVECVECVEILSLVCSRRRELLGLRTPIV